MINDLSILTYTFVVFLVSMFFSFIYWLHNNIEDITKDNYIIKLVKGITHTLIGAFIGITVFVGLEEFYSFSRTLNATVGVLAAINVDVVLFLIKRKGQEL